MSFEIKRHAFAGPRGSLKISADDEVTLKLAMLIEGECGQSNRKQVAGKYGFSRQRYFQLRAAFAAEGALALHSDKRGPKRNYRRSTEVVCQAIRHRFLDPDASSEVIAQKLRQCGFQISKRSIDRVFFEFGLQKKLCQCRPDRLHAEVETFRTKRRLYREAADPASLERGVRQLLANKISGSLTGLWLLLPEHVRLGTWDLLRQWTGVPGARVEPRLALQLVHEAALCSSGLRTHRSLSQKGFALAHGLPFVASDQAIHDLLDAHTVAQAEALQVSLGLLRKARGHFSGRLLAIDPHRLRSYSKRQMTRYRGDEHTKPYKVTPTFFCLDAETHQPVCFTVGVSSKSVAQVTPPLLGLAANILNPRDERPLVVADTEHYTGELLEHVATQTPFDLLVPMPSSSNLLKKMRALPEDAFVRQWAGFALARQDYYFEVPRRGPYTQYIQRSGERASAYEYKGFLATTARSDADDLTLHFPKRWHIEEFFNAHQALGWQRAGTLNLNIRYGHMTAALVAQAVIQQFRERLGKPYAEWDAPHLAQAVFRGLDGDVRVEDDTIVVTYYNAPNAEGLRQHYQNLPAKLAQENVDPRLPWLFDFKLDFRFK